MFRPSGTYGLVALLLVALPARSALAQLAEMRSTRDGRGTLTFTARSSMSDVSRLTVNLRRGNAAEITTDKGVRETFRGTWRMEGPSTARITLTYVGRDRATGGGVVRVDGRGSFAGVQLSGSIGRNVRFSLTFNAHGGSGGGWGGSGGTGGDVTDLDRTEKGQGQMRVAGRPSTSQYDRLRVRLMRDHEFEIMPSPGFSDVVRGRWWQDGPDQVRLDVTSVGRESATGQGTVELSGRSFRQVGMNGRIGSATFNFTFQAGRFQPGRPESGGDGAPTLSDRDRRRFVNRAREYVSDEFDGRSRLSWEDETVGRVVFGNRTVTGRVTVRGGSRPGRFRYTVVMGANTLDRKSVRID